MIEQDNASIRRQLARLRRSVDYLLMLNGVAYGVAGTVLLINLLMRIIR